MSAELSDKPDPRPVPDHLPFSSTVERVADELRRAILAGELGAGIPLREVALARAMGVSRATVHEALGLLVAWGLAVHAPNVGTSVAAPDDDAVRDLFRARAVLEVEGVRRWPTAPEAARDAVRSALVDYTGAVRDGAPYHVVDERHLALHLSLVGLIGSTRLVAAAAGLHAELRLALAQVRPARRAIHARDGAHGDLVRLLETGEVEAAVAEVARHLERAETALLEARHPPDDV